MKNNVIAVWGNGGAGKSMVSCAIANRLATKDVAAIVISTNKQTPMMRTYLPLIEEKSEYSLGKLLNTSVTLGALRDKILVHPQNSNFGFMSLVSGDNSLIYQSKWELASLHQIVDLVQQHELAAYVVFDCTSNILEDNGTLFALENAAAVVRVMSPDNRSISFLEAQMPVLRGGNFQPEKHITTLNNVYPYSPVAQMKSDWGYSFALPHSQAAYKHYLTGQLIRKLDGQEGYRYDMELEKLTEKVVDNLDKRLG